MRYVIMLNLVICLVVSLKTGSKADSELINAMTRVVHKYFSHLQCVCMISEKSDGYLLQEIRLPQYISSFRVIVEHDLTSFSSVYGVKTVLKTVFEQAGVGFIVQLTNPRSFLDAWKDIAKSAFYRHNPRFLIMPTSTKNSASGEILSSKITEFLVDITIVDLIVADGSKQILQFVTANWDLTKHVIATCEVHDCLDLTEDLFPNKILNLQKKELKVATFTYPPYSILEPLDGTEVRIAVEYCRKHNCTIRVVTDNAQWGRIHENGTGDGILGTVAEGRADVGLGAVYLWYYEYHFLDYSTPYIRTGVTCLAPKPGLLSALFLFVRPFTLLTWLMVASVLCIASAALFFIKKLDIFINRGNRKDSQGKKPHNRWFTTKADTVLRAFGFLVLQTFSNQLIEVHSIRHLVNWLHVMCLLITTSYNSGLASIFTIPLYLPAIDSVTDLVNSGLGWGATHDAWIFSLREASLPETKTLVGRFMVLPSDRLHSLSVEENFAFSIERLPAGQFAIGEYITVESMAHLRLMKEDIYYEHCTIALQKGSPFTDSFNQLIHQLLGSGLLQFWEGDVARKFLLSSVQEAVRESTMALYVPQYNDLALYQIQGAFLVLAAGLGVALLAFLGELYLGRGRSRGATQQELLKGVKKTVRFTLYPDKDSNQYGFFF